MNATVCVAPVSGRTPSSRRHRALLSGLIVLGALAHPHLAQASPVQLRVSRGDAAGSCPDSESLWAVLHELAPTASVERSTAASAERSAAAPGELRFHIDIEREGLRFRARLTVEGAAMGHREIVDDDPECGGLGQALALAILLIADPSWSLPAAPQQSSAAVAISTPVAPTTPVLALPVLAPKVVPVAAPISRPAQFARHPSGSASPHRLSPLPFETFGLGTLGVMQGVAEGVALGGGVRHVSGVALRLRALFLVPKEYSAGAGTIQVGLGGAFLGACFSGGRGRTHSRPWAWTPCFELGVGLQRGVAQGSYTTAYPAVTRPWLTLGPSLTWDGPIAGRLRWLVTGAILVAPQAEHFTIPGLTEPTVYRQSAVSGVLGLGLGWSADSFARK